MPRRPTLPEEWPPPGCGPVGFLLVIFVQPPAGHRRLPLPYSITWMSLPCRRGSCLLKLPKIPFCKWSGLCYVVLSLDGLGLIVSSCLN